jgi:hypothetical protein
MSHAGSQRATRLVSAGVPITDAFQAVVEEIIDNGPADFDTLNKRVQTAMFLKEKRILSAGWRTWEDFTHDILDQISGVDSEAVPTLVEIQGKWSAIEFTKGVAYQAIPRANVTYMVWDEATRLRRDTDARKQMDVKRLKGEVQQLLDRYDWDESDRTQLKRNISSLGNMERRLNGFAPVGEDDEVPEGAVKAPRGSKASDVPVGPLGWARGWLRDHPGEWTGVTTLHDLYVKEFSITETVSMGSIAKGLASDAADPVSRVQRRREVVMNGRALVQYAWMG